jgi:hypothetical protein
MNFRHFNENWKPCVLIEWKQFARRKFLREGRFAVHRIAPIYLVLAFSPASLSAVCTASASFGERSLGRELLVELVSDDSFFVEFIQLGLLFLEEFIFISSIRLVDIVQPAAGNVFLALLIHLADGKIEDG